MPIAPEPSEAEVEAAAEADHRQARNLRHDGPESAVTQALFKAGEDGLLVSGLKIDDAVRLQAGLREGWREQIGSSDTPEHLSSCARGDAGSE